MVLTHRDNPRLRAAIDNALAVNMPRDTMDRAIARGVGNSDEGALDEITYEGYGPGGVAFLVETMTDNRNRTVAAVRHAFSKHGGSLGTTGSVAFQFDRRGVLHFDNTTDEDAIMELALESGAEDVESDEEGNSIVFTTYETFSEVLAAFKETECVPTPCRDHDVAIDDNRLRCVVDRKDFESRRLRWKSWMMCKVFYTNAELSDLTEA